MAINGNITISDETAAKDLDFMAFSFNGKHSYEDFGIYRTSNGSRYNSNLTPQLSETTADNPAADGMFYFSTRHKQKNFNINFAFTEMPEKTMVQLKQWLDGKEMGDLWFAEEPYKIYSAKVTGQPSFNYVAFRKEEIDDDGNLVSTRVYSGEGTVQFVAYWPYAHTPGLVNNQNGKRLSSYNIFANKDEWKDSSGLKEDSGACMGENQGQLPAPFVLKHSGSIKTTTTFTITNDIYIIVEGSESCVYKDLTWDSKTGIVTAITNLDQVAKPIPIKGNPLGAIPVGGCTPSKGSSTLEYHYWYY